MAIVPSGYRAAFRYTRAHPRLRPSANRKIRMRKVLFIFSELRDDDIEWLASAGERQRLAAGDTLVDLGAQVQNIWFVLEGELSVLSAGGSPIAKLASGEVIGEMTLVDPATTTVSVVAASDSRLLRVPIATVRAKLATDPGFAARFYRALCVFLAARLRSTSRQMGFGSADPDTRDELNEDLLDHLHLAGARFDRMMKRLAG